MSDPDQSPPQETRSISEGKASLLVAKDKVFYNEVQRTNRDVSIIGIRTWSELYGDSFRHRAMRAQERKERKEQKAQKEPQNGNIENSKEFNETTKETTDSTADTASLKPFSDPYITILEALSATGLRAIRYAKEIPDVKYIIANDFSSSAVQSISSNVRYNDVADLVIPNEDDANTVMHKHKKSPFHVIDLDPYGSATPFIDAAVQSIQDDGLLLVTCTDLGVLAGNAYPEKCFSYYGGTTLHNDACHESALRLVLHMVAATAAKYGKSIEPMASLSINFYVRLFIKVKKSPAQVKLNQSKTMLVYNCTGCGTHTCQPLGRATATPDKKFSYKYSWATGPTVDSKCQFCASTHHIVGPMWAGSLHNKDFVKKMLDIHASLDPEVYKTLDWLKGMLTQVHDELDDVPFFVRPSTLAAKIKASTIPLIKFESALLNAGYRISGTHCRPGCVKTDAPFNFMWDIMKTWISQSNNGKPTKVNERNPAYKLVESLETEHDVSFEEHPTARAHHNLRQSRTVRFPNFPENWGPKARPEN